MTKFRVHAIVKYQVKHEFGFFCEYETRHKAITEFVNADSKEEAMELVAEMHKGEEPNVFFADVYSV